jgi:CheY-like chemotaxis protein
VTIEANAQEAMFKAAEDNVDVIVVSLGLTGYDALRLCSQIRALERTRNLPILVIADLEGSGNLDVFVANDMTANFLFRNLSDPQQGVRFHEEALLRGLAFDRDGQAKACMGVAAGDFNRDGRLDLFVTNFYRQSNDLYRQLDDGTFRDVSREARLYDPSFLQLGWGTQFLDADLDGHSDLFVTNGHVHEPNDAAIPYQMRSQFFRNQGNGRFEELFSDVLGAFFDRKSLGRPLARLDWNRDGLEDACISYMNEPLALVSNRTENPGHFIALRLVGVNSSRDAIGTRVTVTSGAGKWFAQLTAGDGFQASNDRRIVIGLGETPQIDALEIHWNSGVSQRVEGLASDRAWICIEGRTPIECKTPGRRPSLE